MFFNKNCWCNRCGQNDCEQLDQTNNTLNCQNPNGCECFIPQIGANGNWWINGFDTGMRAQGLNGNNGIDGETPLIGENGNWWIAGQDTNLPSRGEKGETGETFIPDYGTFYSVTAQNFEGSSEYSTIRFDDGSKSNGIVYGEDGYFSFTKEGLYDVWYTATLTNFVDTVTFALVSDDGIVNSASNQVAKHNNSQTIMRFFDDFDTTRKWKLGILSSTSSEVGTMATNLVNASICFMQIPTV